MAGNRKLLGCCTNCDKPAFEVVSRYTEGPYKGEIRQVGRPLPGSVRVGIIRASGNHSFWTLCPDPDCEINELSIVRMNKKEVRAMAKERESSSLNNRQSEYNSKMLRLFEWDIPIGVIATKPWVEVK